MCPICRSGTNQAHFCVSELNSFSLPYSNPWSYTYPKHPYPTTEPFKPTPLTITPLTGSLKFCSHCWHEKKIDLKHVKVKLKVCCWCSEAKTEVLDSDINKKHGRYEL